MTDIPKPINRIPFESLTEEQAVSAWSLPAMDQKKSRIVFSAKREKEQQKQGGQGSVPSELVEDYKHPVKPKPITAEELQKITEQAKKEGLEAGYAEGFTRGMQEGSIKGHQEGQNKAYRESKQKLDGEIERLKSIAGALLDPFNHQENELERIVLDMAMKFACELIEREIKSVPSIIVDTINKALLALPAGAQNVRVYVNSKDAEIIAQYIPEPTRNWLVHIDDKLTSGGCRVETLESLVDYSVETRIEKYKQLVREGGEKSEAELPPLQDYEIEIDLALEKQRAELKKMAAQVEPPPVRHVDSPSALPTDSPGIVRSDLPTASNLAEPEEN